MAMEKTFDASEAEGRIYAAWEKAGAFAKKYSKALTPGDSSNVESFKVRRGKVGGFAGYFTGDDLSFADQLMARYDYNQALQKVSAVSLI